MIDWLLGQVPAYLLDFVVTSINGLWELLAQTVFITPDVTDLPQVQAISARSLAIVNASFVLAITVTGVIVMTRDTIQSRYGIAELGPRLVIGFVAANFATPICRSVIKFANAVTGALTGEGIASRDSLTQLLRVITSAMTTPGNPMLISIIGLFIGVLIAMLLVAWIVRLIVLIVAVGIAPVALACHASPFTDSAARLWWRTLIGCTGTVVLQALALHTTMSVFLDPAANLPALGMPEDPTGTFNLFVVACLLWVTIRIPSMVSRYVTSGGGNRNVAGYVLRLVVIQQLTRGLGRGLSKGATSRNGRRLPPPRPQADGYPRPPAPPRTPRPAGTGWPQGPRPAVGPSLRGNTTGTGWPATPTPASTPSGGSPSRSSRPSAQPSTRPAARSSTGQSPAPSGSSAPRPGAQGPGGRPTPRRAGGPITSPGVGWPGSGGRRAGGSSAAEPQAPRKQPSGQQLSRQRPIRQQGPRAPRGTGGTGSPGRFGGSDGR
jgi:hypothetical protein